MNRPRRYLTRMALFLAIVALGVAALIKPLMLAFQANPWLNGVILGVLLVGILYNFRTVIRLYPEVSWLEGFRRDQAGGDAGPEGAPLPRLLAPMAKMLGDKKGRLMLSAPSMRTLMDGVGARLEESRDTARYMIGLLVFLGLLGTFWGLLHTVNEVAKVIGGLSISGEDMAAGFAQLKSGLEAPLGGMGTAFSASLFGLAGSLVLGFLELQVGQAQNRFYNDLEEWLSGLTRLSSGGPGGDDQSVPAYIQALLEQTADSLDHLTRIVATAEDNRGQVTQNLMALNERLTAFTEQMRTERQLMLRLAESQLELKPVMTRLVSAIGDGKMGGGDDASRAHLRNLEIYCARLLEELGAGRTQAVQEIRNEIRLLARTIAAVAEEGQR